MRGVKRWLRSNRWFHLAYRRSVSNGWRWWYGLRHVHPTFLLNPRCSISRDLIAGEYGYMGPECSIGPCVELGPYVMLAGRVSVVGGDHRFDHPGVPMIFAGRAPIRRTVVEADAWIGHGAILMAGIHVGHGAIVGAGAVVTRDVPPYEIHAGVPARKIGERFPDAADRTEHDAMLSRPPTCGCYAEMVEGGPAAGHAPSR